MINSNSLQIENRMSITRSEKILMQANAALLGIGTTAGFFVEGLWFASTPVDYGGLGLVLSGAGAAVTISLVGIVSALTAIPIAYLFYKMSSRWRVFAHCSSRGEGISTERLFLPAPIVIKRIGISWSAWATRKIK